MDKNYNNFFKTYNIYKDCWKSIDIRIMCMKDSSGVWNNLITNINPIPNTIKKCSEFTHLLSIDNLQITQKFDSIANFDQILNQVLSGQLVIDDMQINYSRLFEPKQPYNYIYHNSNRKQANDSFNLDNRYFYLEGHGEEMRQFIDRDQKEYIDSVLKSGDVPYNGLQDFAENFLFFNRRNPSDWYNYST